MAFLFTIPTSADNTNEYHLPATLQRIIFPLHLVLSHEGRAVDLQTTEATTPVTSTGSDYTRNYYLQEKPLGHALSSRGGLL